MSSEHRLAPHGVVGDGRRLVMLVGSAKLPASSREVPKTVAVKLGDAHLSLREAGALVAATLRFLTRRQQLLQVCDGCSKIA